MLFNKDKKKMHVSFRQVYTRDVEKKFSPNNACLKNIFLFNVLFSRFILIMILKTAYIFIDFFLKTNKQKNPKITVFIH